MRFGYLDKFEKHETPVGEWSTRAHVPQHGIYRTHRQPVNDFQALMETVPYQSEPMTEEERESDWSGFQQKLDAAGLTERESIVLDSIVFGGMSLTQAGDHLARCEGKNRAVSKTEIARIRDRAFEKLRTVFKEEQ